MLVRKYENNLTILVVVDERNLKLNENKNHCIHAFLTIIKFLTNIY